MGMEILIEFHLGASALERELRGQLRRGVRVDVLCKRRNRQGAC